MTSLLNTLWLLILGQASYQVLRQFCGEAHVERDQGLSQPTEWVQKLIPFPQVEPSQETTAATNSLTITSWENVKARGIKLSHTWIPEAQKPVIINVCYSKLLSDGVMCYKAIDKTVIVTDITLVFHNCTNLNYYSRLLD